MNILLALHYPISIAKLLACQSLLSWVSHTGYHEIVLYSGFFLLFKLQQALARLSCLAQSGLPFARLHHNDKQ